MAITLLQEALMYSVYFAPRGRKRLLNLGHQISQRYLSPLDNLVGVIGDAGAGKSVFIKGMFPGLELTNDDDGVNVRPLPLLDGADTGFFSSHTYHIDVRFESAFTQIYMLADAVKEAVSNGKRVIVEHFELLYPYLNMNADIIIGIGEEVIVTRPSIFGPCPGDIANIVHKSIKYRRMAHTAEDLTGFVLEKLFGFEHCEGHNDVKHGFVLEFDTKPNIDIDVLEEKTKELINKNVDVCYVDDNHISIDNIKFPCTGPRIHLKNSSEIEHFKLVKELKYNPLTNSYALIGIIGFEEKININELNSLKYHL
ncbi:alanine-tRNA synthetase second additional domain-containing protein [Vallitalea guaymasensis]|uniref:Alanine-tRNA synthetase second additional domain-containing protein n=1 Tax=Vallitalea guaymasensis TaxID=1185412 RepID=A0A8J8SAK8_9FIRM|nr:alanine-tRNA synthetase second additional domain-containing protein [Vallitalea guaymasensis]QUH27772.1 alanine-tRNA synthetase second additional domain-containing protein [Vallitalea guaymasensis]